MDSNEKAIAVRAVYKNVLGNAYLMESERAELAYSESCFTYTGNAKEFVRAVAQSDAYRTRYFEPVTPMRFVESVLPGPPVASLPLSPALPVESSSVLPAPPVEWLPLSVALANASSTRRRRCCRRRAFIAGPCRARRCRSRSAGDAAGTGCPAATAAASRTRRAAARFSRRLALSAAP
eukprot:TRINITY_DN163_c0_g2_i1.p2 TRINITY_DN163_c0_g2~~TRINITY_DN163_c0_g2_i1.p2  ORF type:complete len:202 (-),score=33.48 TRINITY_DN163_c0_g2_i1:411-947(-)